MLCTTELSNTLIFLKQKSLIEPSEEKSLQWLDSKIYYDQRFFYNKSVTSYFLQISGNKNEVINTNENTPSFKKFMKLWLSDPNLTYEAIKSLSEKKEFEQLVYFEDFF